MANNVRKRNWTTLLYEESMKDDAFSIMSELCVPIFVSPIHNQDCNEDGEIKKAHYHIMLMFDGNKSKEQVQTVVDKFGGVGLEVVECTRAYARYLCHLDNDDKAQYDVHDVKCFGGAQYLETIQDEFEDLMEFINLLESLDNCLHSNFYEIVKEVMYENPKIIQKMRGKDGAFIREFIKSRNECLKGD